VAVKAGKEEAVLATGRAWDGLRRCDAWFEVLVPDMVIGGHTHSKSSVTSDFTRIENGKAAQSTQGW
jgi:hypothetical protein